MRPDRVRDRIVAAFVGALVCAAGASRARLEFPSVPEQVAGARFALAPASHDSLRAGARIECGDIELFGIAGLRASGVRAAAARGPVFAGAEIVRLGSPVGAHTRLVAEAGGSVRGAWEGVVRAGVERLALSGFPPDDTPVVGVANRIDVGRVSAVADVEAGMAAIRTIGIALAVCARAGPAQLAATIRIEDGRLAAAGASVAANLHPRLVLLCGYDDASASLRAGALVRAAGLEVSVGAFQHPVLGASQGVSLAWARAR